MSRISNLLLAAIVALVGVATANQTWNVPGDFPLIQTAISSPLVVDGDTISVWGPSPWSQTAPYYYYENVDFHGKKLVVASRCFLPGWTGCEPTYDSVIIDGQQLGRVVTMTGSADAVLKGFTIQHGHTSGYGGGVNCNAGSVLKNHIRYNGAVLGGGGVYYGNWINANCWIEDNVIEHDTAPGGGGGILVWDWPT